MQSEKKKNASLPRRCARIFREALKTVSNRRFLLEELVKRDFRNKYKRTVLGIGWSLLGPLLTLLIMRMVFTCFFGRMEHFTTYLFCGTLIMGYFKDATNSGMGSFVDNAGVITKIKLPKYMFLFSRNISALINLLITLPVFFAFCAWDGIEFKLNFLCLLYPAVCLFMLNTGTGLILSTMYVFFRDTKYLYGVFLTLLTYVSAIFYPVDRFPEQFRKLFLLNPVYVHISYFREIILNGAVPPPELHLLCFGYALLIFAIGTAVYHKFNGRFLYYV